MQCSTGHCQLQPGCSQCRQSQPCSSAKADQARVSFRWPLPWLSGAESSARQHAISEPAALLRPIQQYRWECGKAARSAARAPFSQRFWGIQRCHVHVQQQPSSNRAADRTIIETTIESGTQVPQCIASSLQCTQALILPVVGVNASGVCGPEAYALSEHHLPPKSEVWH